MAIGQATLQFLLNVQNNASAALGAAMASFSGLGSAAQAASGNVQSMAQAVTGAVEAVLELEASIGTLRAGIDTFAEYEQRMSIVEKVTGSSKDQMHEFEQAFDQMTRTMRGGASVDQLANFAGQASQLGIRGSDDILKFTSTMSKLANTTADIGEQGAKEFARLLNVTGAGADGAEHLGSVITALGKQTAATEGSILHAASTIAQTTAQFRLSGEAVLGLGAAAAELNFPAQLFGTGVSRALISIRDNAINGTAAMKELEQISGMTAGQWRELVRDDPTGAFLKFAAVVKAFNDSGRSPTAFLTSFKLQAQEEVRVLGTIGEQLDRFKNAQNAARGEQGSTALNQENSVAIETMNKQIAAVQNSWYLLKKDFGEALAPAFEVALRGVGMALDWLDAKFKALPSWAKQVTAWSLVLIPAVAGVTAAIGVLGAALSGLASVGAFSGIAATFGAVSTAVVAAIGLVAAALASPLAPIIALVVGIGALAFEFGKFVGYISENWDQVKAFFAQPLDQIVAQAWTGTKTWITDFLAGVADTTRAAWNNVLSVFAVAPAKSMPAIVPEPYGENDPDQLAKRASALPPGVTDTAGLNLSSQTLLSPGDQKAIEQLDKRSKKLEEIRAQEQAIQNLQNLPANDPRHVGDDEIARLRAILELEKTRSDTVASSVKKLQDSAEAAAAYGAQARNNLEIENAIRAAKEKEGTLTAQQTQAIRDQVQALQAARQTAALAENSYESEKSLATARAVTQEQKNYIAGQIKVLDFEKEHGALTEAQRSAMLGQLQALQQTQQLLGVIGQVDPVSGANQKYKDDVQTLDKAMKDGTLTAAQYKTLLNDLNQQTLEARDPWAAQVRSMREAIGVASIMGEYQDEDRRTQEQVNALRDRGLTVTQQQADAVRDYNRAMSDASRLQGSGIEGWMKQVGDYRSAILDMQKDVISGLSDGLVGAITGSKNAWESMLNNISKQFLTLGVNGLLRGAMSGVDNSLGGLFSELSGKDALGRASAAADKLGKLDNISSQIMTVYAGTVTVTSSANGAAGVTNAAGNPVAAMSALGSMSPSNLQAAASAIKTMESGGRYGITGPTVTYKDGTTDNPYGAYQVMGRNVGPWTQAYYGKSLSPDEFLKNKEAQDAVFNGRFQGYATKYGSYDAAAQAWLGGEGSVGKAGVRDPVTGMTVGRYSQRFDQLYAQNGGGALNTTAVSPATNVQAQQAAAAAKAANDNLKATGTSLQQVSTSASTAASDLQQAGSAVGQTGQQAQSAAPQITQAADALAQAKNAANSTGTGTAPQGAFGSLGGFSGASDLGQLGAVAGRGLASSLGGQYAGVASTGMNFFLQALKLHSGGHVGYGGGEVVSMPSSMFASAPRFHSGLNDDEFAAVLQRGERVMTADQSRKVSAAAGAGSVHYHEGDRNFRITTQSSGSPAQDHQAAERQIRMINDMLDQHSTKWSINESRPGGLLAKAS